MRVHKAVDVAGIVRGLHRHMTVGALLRLRRIVERTRSLPGDATGLPIVVFVKATEPAVVVHWNVEMYFVTGRTKLSGLRAHERLKEDTPVRLRIELDHEVMQGTRDGAL